MAHGCQGVRSSRGAHGAECDWWAARWRRWHVVVVSAREVSMRTNAASLKDRLQSAAEQGKGSTALVFREFARFNGLLSRERAQDSFGIVQVRVQCDAVACC